MAFTIALSAGAGSQAATAFNFVHKIIWPSPYEYLKGHYRGDWHWTENVDGSKIDKESQDNFFITEVDENRLKGSGVDFNLGNYTFTGYIRGKELYINYSGDPNSGQPSTGAAILKIESENKKVTLSGKWNGVINSGTINGLVTLSEEISSE